MPTLVKLTPLEFSLLNKAKQKRLNDAEKVKQEKLNEVKSGATAVQCADGGDQRSSSTSASNADAVVPKSSRPPPAVRQRRRIINPSPEFCDIIKYADRMKRRKRVEENASGNKIDHSLQPVRRQQYEYNSNYGGEASKTIVERILERSNPRQDPYYPIENLYSASSYSAPPYPSYRHQRQHQNHHGYYPTRTPNPSYMHMRESPYGYHAP